MDSGGESTSLRLKVLYTFDKNHQTACLARSSSCVDVRVVKLDQQTIGIVSLKVCCLVIASSSPELLSGTDQDYAVYTVDYTEPGTPLTGHGMLSWVLSSNANHQLVIAGRVCSNVFGDILGNSAAGGQTLEVKLQLRPVANTTQGNYKLYKSLSQQLPCSFDPPPQWLTFLHSNPSILAKVNPSPDPPPKSPYMSPAETTDAIPYPASSPPPPPRSRGVLPSSSEIDTHKHALRSQSEQLPPLKRHTLAFPSSDLELPPCSNPDSNKKLPGPPTGNLAITTKLSPDKEVDGISPSSSSTGKKTPGATSSSVRRHLLQKKRIETQLLNAINEGRVPPYCDNCGAIKTSVWRRVKGKKTGTNNNNNNNKNGDMLLCNPCGLYYGTKNRMRPPSCWGKDPKPVNSPLILSDDVIALGVSKSLTTRDNHHTPPPTRVLCESTTLNQQPPQRQPEETVCQVKENTNNGITKTLIDLAKNDKENISPSKTGSPTDNDEEEDDINSLFLTPRKNKPKPVLVDGNELISPSPWVKRLFSLPNSSSPTSVSRGLDCVLEDIRTTTTSFHNDSGALLTSSPPPPSSSTTLFSLRSDDGHSDLWSELATSPVASSKRSSPRFANPGLDLGEYLNSIQETSSK